MESQHRKEVGTHCHFYNSPVHFRTCFQQTNTLGEIHAKETETSSVMMYNMSLFVEHHISQENLFQNPALGKKCTLMTRRLVTQLH